MSKAEEKKQKREGCFLLHWILFYYYKPQGQEHNIVEVWFGLVWFGLERESFAGEAVLLL
jgi:hypothetical protein